MFDFSKVNAVPVTEEFILSKVSQETIFSYYHGNFKFGQTYSSKFRKDFNNSCGFYKNKRGMITYSDFASGERCDCFGFVQKYFGLNYYNALEKVAKDFGLIEGTSSVVPVEVMQQSYDVSDVKEAKLIQFVPDKWNKDNLAYWRLYELDQADLEYEDIYPVKELYLNKLPCNLSDGLPRYAYPLQWEGGSGVKIYNPYAENKKDKWLSSIPNSIPFGLEEIKGRTGTLFLGKAKKDKAVLRKAGLEPILALQNESEYALLPETKEALNEQFSTRYVLFDCDEAGLRAMEAYKDDGYIPLHTPLADYNKYGIKDFADYAKFYGLNALKEYLKQLNIL